MVRLAKGKWVGLTGCASGAGQSIRGWEWVERWVEQFPNREQQVLCSEVG